MSHAIAVKHSFEAAHRLPHLEGKCQSLHGHSWQVEVAVAAPKLDDRGMVVEFGPFKRALREWIDDNLDHGLMLGCADPVLPMLNRNDYDGKLFEFGHIENDWPTVENVATLLARISHTLLMRTPRVEGAYVAEVKVSETAVNTAYWLADR